MHRCFIGARFDERTNARIRAIQDEIRRAGLFERKYTEPENLHVTLKFLGALDDETLRRVQELLSQRAFSVPDVAIDELGVFSPKNIRVVWLHVDGLQYLQEQVDEALRPLFEPERQFIAHLTIARPKQVDREALLDWIAEHPIEPFAGKLQHVALYESELTPEGPLYSVLQELSLAT